MNSWLADLPELRALESRRELIRIPPEQDVPLTPRVRAVIDTPQFRRLAQVRQLGLVSLVYPGAMHQRFEHSLGVYRLGLLFLLELQRDPRFCRLIDPPRAEMFLAAALLHDLGHYPYCHPIEDLRMEGWPRHEELAAGYLQESPLADVLVEQWGLQPLAIARLLAGATESPAEQLLGSMLSCPIDVDKMDYLARDSLHCGVPYGRNFDQQRLLGSLCLNAAGTGLAITDKGKTAAEMLVFARYVMFSEVYWHHTVRAATAMLQRAVYSLRHSLDPAELCRWTDNNWVERLRRISQHQPVEGLLSGLFGPVRKIYKRVAQYSFLEERDLYERLARRPYGWLTRVSRALAGILSTRLGTPVDEHDILFDAPPEEREVEFDLDVYAAKEDRYRRLGDVSPMVRTLAREQFDDYVKRVRIYCAAELRPQLTERRDLRECVWTAIDEANRID
ncbi:MAG: HD domain-containing protein [Pirellulales bacterium]|nr:HD domain-containing protein [Pirellulales bacterium]